MKVKRDKILIKSLSDLGINSIKDLYKLYLMEDQWGDLKYKIHEDLYFDLMSMENPLPIFRSLLQTPFLKKDVEIFLGVPQILETDKIDFLIDRLIKKEKERICFYFYTFNSNPILLFLYIREIKNKFIERGDFDTRDVYYGVNCQRNNLFFPLNMEYEYLFLNSLYSYPSRWGASNGNSDSTNLPKDKTAHILFADMFYKKDLSLPQHVSISYLGVFKGDIMLMGAPVPNTDTWKVYERNFHLSYEELGENFTYIST